MTPTRIAAALAALLALAAPAPAGDALPPGAPVEAAVDHFIDARLADEGVSPAAQADDATLARRLTLDLVGRVPTTHEARQYAESADPAKRAKLVERLAGSPGFTRHLANELDGLLMPAGRGSLREYLARRLAGVPSWEVVFRDLMTADESDPARKGAGEFLRSRVKDVDRMTADVSRLFFGVDVSCAKCHDHPLVEDWKQSHYFGMQSFLARTVDTGKSLGERGSGLVTYLTTKGESRTAKMMFLTGTTVELPEPPAEEQKREKEAFEAAKKAKTATPAPKVSARARLVELALQPDQRGFFARALVNRTWHRLFGRGLVTPLDQMHPENEPSHPELLEWLARDTAEHGYDLRRLVRGLVMSRAYSRASRWESGTPPKPELFAVAQVRPLEPDQLAASLRVATADPDQFGPAVAPADLEKRFAAADANGRDFAALIARPAEDFQIGVSEALLFSNAARFQRDYLASSGLLGRLEKSKTDAEAVELATRAALGRAPSVEEATLFAGHLRDYAGRRGEGLRQLAWALLTCPEFRFNY